MKLKMTVIYGDEICESLKEAFNCTTDEELLGGFKLVMAQALRQEAYKDEDISIVCEKID